MATILYKKGESDQALALYEKTIPVLREHGARLFVINPLLTQGKIFLGRGRLLEAQASIQEALAVAEQIQFKEYTLDARILVARLAFAQGDEEQAWQQLHELLANSDDEVEQAKLHFEIWRVTAEHEHARAAYELYSQLNEQIPKFDFQRRIIELQTIVG